MKEIHLLTRFESFRISGCRFELAGEINHSPALVIDIISNVL